MKVALIEGWPVFLSMASMTLMTSSNTIILNTVASAAEVGYMNAAYRLIIASKALTNPITTAVYPHMSKLARNSPQEGLRFFRKQVLWMAAPFLVISLGMLVFSPLAVRIIYGGRFQESGVLLQIMSFTPVIHSVSMCFGTYYMLAYGFEKEWSKIITRMVILNFVVLGILLLILPPTRAVALTTTMMDLFSAGSCALFYRRTSDSVGKRSSTIEETSVPMATPAEEL
jgi:PST family polysaccharide transporter